MGGAHQSLVRRLIRTIRKPGFWLILVLLVLITLPYYGEGLKHPDFLTRLIAGIGLERHAFERVLYLIPIVWAGFLFGWRGSVVTSLTALACMLPRAVLISAYPRDALFESGTVFIIGNVLAISFHALRRERERRVRLAALNRTSSMVSQSLELGQVLNGSINSIIEVMRVDAAMVFLLDEAQGQLTLATHRGVSTEFVQGVNTLKLGEGFNGRVAETGESLYVEDAAQDPSLTKIAVRQEGIRSQLIVPLKSKGKVVGTLCVATRRLRQVLPEELELVTAIGNQIGVAIENARLYQKQQEVAEEMRAMQENLHFFVQRVTVAQEDERKRISRELHDDTIQALVVLSRELDDIASNAGEISEENRLRLEKLLAQTDDIIKGVRRLSQDLRPAALDRLGLLPGLKWLASDVAGYSGIKTILNVVGTERRLPEQTELVLFRITQEALRNVWRHSKATTAEINVEFTEKETKITVNDNGKGFHLPPIISDLARDGKLGLAGMQERARLIDGNLTVTSQPGKGSSITVEVPA
jgi:signal transduction histidine kinase